MVRSWSGSKGEERCEQRHRVKDRGDNVALQQFYDAMQYPEGWHVFQAGTLPSPCAVGRERRSTSRAEHLSWPPQSSATSGAEPFLRAVSLAAPLRASSPFAKFRHGAASMPS